MAHVGSGLMGTWGVLFPGDLAILLRFDNGGTNALQVLGMSGGIEGVFTVKSLDK